MKKIIFSLIFVFFPCVFFNSCEKNSDTDIDCSTYDYSDCNTTEPFLGNLHAKLTINYENSKIPISIYLGNLEDNIIVLRDTAYKSTYDTLLEIGEYYTVKAEYKQGSKTIFAVDGDKVSKSKTKTCDSVCWSVRQANVNLKLK